MSAGGKGNKHGGRKTRIKPWRYKGSKHERGALEAKEQRQQQRQKKK